MSVKPKERDDQPELFLPQVSPIIVVSLIPPGVLFLFVGASPPLLFFSFLIQGSPVISASLLLALGATCLILSSALLEGVSLVLGA